MSSSEILQDVVRHLREQLGDGPADVELLAQYAQGRDEAAFAALVRRHGGLVFGVACRQLADRQLAEDVFQATFLMLARSAARLRRPGSLANWLYTVALRQARKLQLRTARRTAFEQTLSPRPNAPSDPLAEISARELVTRIDEELARLPERYRLPLLLCGVEGLSREEAARHLGWSEGSVRGRLERGRRQLAARLAKHGIAPSAVVLAPLATVAVPGDLFASTAALAASPWSKSIPAAVLALAASQLPSRLLSAVALLGSLLAVSLVGLALGSAPDEPTKSTPVPPPDAPPRAERPAEPLPAGSTLRLGTSSFRHGTAIARLAVSADDRIAVASSGNHWLGSARAFDLATGKVVYTLTGSPYVEAVAISPDGRTLACREGNTIVLCDAATGKEVRKIELPEANPRTLTEFLTFTPDGKALAAASEGKVIHLLDLDKGQVIRSFAHQHAIFAVAFSADGRWMAGGGYDSENNRYFGRLWEVATGKELGRFANGQAGIRTLAFSPDGSTLAGGGDDGRLRLWDAASGKERRAFPADGRRIRTVAFAPDGRTVAAAGATIRLYDPTTGEERLKIERQAIGVAFSADGKTLTAAVAGAIHRWDAASGRPLTPQTAGDSAVDQILVTPNGRRVLTRDQANQVHIWDAASGKHVRRLDVGFQRGMALSPDGRFLVWSDAAPEVHFKDPQNPRMIHEGSRIRLYDLAADQMIERFPAYPGDAHDLAFAPDGQTLIGVDHGAGTVRLWDMASGKEKRTFRTTRGEEKRAARIWYAVLSPDGRTLALAYHRQDHTTAFFGPAVVRLWDVATGRERHELAGHVNQVLGLVFSPDSRLLISCAENPHGGNWGGQRSPTDSVFVWDVATGERLAVVSQGLSIGAGSVAFSPDGRTLATASTDGLIRLWEVTTWKVRTTFRGHRDRVSALAFMPDGRLLSGSLDSTVLAWDLRSPPTEGDGPLSKAWEHLAQSDAGVAFRAMGQLRAAPAEAVELIAARVKPAEAVDPKRLAALIADLDSPAFATRQQAADALKLLGGQAEAALRAAKDKAGSLEMRRRVEKVLAEVEKSTPAPDELRVLRAIEALEWIATPRARQGLAALARGAPEARRTRAADAALQRLTTLRPGLE